MTVAGRHKGPPKGLEELLVVLESATEEKREELLNQIEKRDPVLAKMARVRLKQEKKVA